jgi:Flp pilus assembly protein TadG
VIMHIPLNAESGCKSLGSRLADSCLSTQRILLNNTVRAWLSRSFSNRYNRLVRHRGSDRAGFLCDERGIAGTEFALVATVLCFLLLNGIEFARYAWVQMQVENAAQMGAQAVWRACDPNKLPLNPRCPGYETAVDAAIRSTSLGSGVTRQGLTSGYYCVDTADGLKLVATASPPANCSATGRLDLAPGYFAETTATYTYAPLFADLTIAKLFNTSVTKTARMRLQ